MDINTLLDECKNALEVKTDYQLYKATGMNEARISECRRGLRGPSIQMLFIISEVLEMDAKKLIAHFEAESARSKETKEFWQKKLAELGGIAASFIFSVNLVLTCALFTPNKSMAYQVDNYQSIHYAK